MIRKNLNICNGHRSNPNIERNAVKYWCWGVIFINSFMMNLLCSLQKWRNSRSWINILWLKMVINNETYWKPPQLFFNPFNTSTIRVSLKNHILHGCRKEVHWLLVYDREDFRNHTLYILFYYWHLLLVKDTVKLVSTPL